MFAPVGPIFWNPNGLDVGAIFRLSRNANTYSTVFGRDLFSNSENLADSRYHYVFAPFSSNSSISKNICFDLYTLRPDISQLTRTASIIAANDTTTSGSNTYKSNIIVLGIFHSSTGDFLPFLEAKHSELDGFSIRFFPPPSHNLALSFPANMTVNTFLGKCFAGGNNLYGLYKPDQIVFGYLKFKSPNDNSSDFAGYNNYTLPNFVLPVLDYNFIEIALYEDLNLQLPANVANVQGGTLTFFLRIRQATNTPKTVSWWNDIIWLSNNGNPPDLSGPRLITSLIAFEYDKIRNVWLGDFLTKY